MSTFRRPGWISSAQIVWLLLSWISVSAVATVPSSWSVRLWQTDDGLPDNSVTGVAQNSAGYLWVATQGGLALFDGVRFQEVELNTPSQRTRPLIRSMPPSSASQSVSPFIWSMERMSGRVRCDGVFSSTS